jgi:hypothetical protein
MTAEPAKSWRRLLVVCIAAAAIWIVALPRIAAVDHVRSRIEYLESKEVDPSALYYTDLEAMTRLEARVAHRRRESPKAFWAPSGRSNSAEPAPGQ